MTRIAVIQSNHTEEELYEEFPWLKRADIEHAVVGMKNGVFVWYDGFWKDGTWKYGEWHDGEWHDGEWHHGTWYNGIWHDGVWKDGIWYNGTWSDGEWNDGIWHNGEWNGGAWNGGTWHNGEWHQGYINNELSKIPPNITKIKPHEKQKSSENHYIRQIKNPTLYNLADKLSRM